MHPVPLSVPLSAAAAERPLSQALAEAYVRERVMRMTREGIEPSTYGLKEHFPVPGAQERNGQLAEAQAFRVSSIPALAAADLHAVPLSVPRWWVLLLALLLLALIARPGRGQVLSEQQTMGRYLSGYMTAVGITQDSLARLVPWLASSQTARVNRLSAIRNGTVAAGDSELVRIGRTIDSLFRARLAPSAEARAWAIVTQVRPVIRPVPPPAPSAPLPPPPPAPVPAPPPAPSRTIAIAGGRMNIDGVTYWLDVPGHALATGARVIVRGHAATPSFDGDTLTVTRTSASALLLWRDAARTVPVVAPQRGGRGTLEILL